MSSPRRLATTVVSSHRFFDVLEHELAAANGSRTVVTFSMPDWVSIVALDDADRFVLVRQHRHGIDAQTLEPAGGLVDPGEDPAASALRELFEETGHRAAHAEPLGFVHPNPALQNNRCHFFLARGAQRVAAPRISESEHTEVVLLDRDELRAALAGGRITHALAVLAFVRALERLGSV